MKNNTIYTIGHSTRTIDEFINILLAFEIELVVDVRTIPGSRHNPQFNENELKQELKLYDIEYSHLKELGGLRHTTKTSINTAWKNSSFRGFADYMQTPEFKKGIELLIGTSKLKQTVIMCAEAVALVVRNIEVEDIMSKNSSKPHKITPWAKVDEAIITYPEAKQ
jgi:uncharacterized protein (DUF488 family)